jgi:hypothetical protein
MTLQKVLEEMLPKEALSTHPTGSPSTP